MLPNYFLTNPRAIFLVDAFGALISTLLLFLLANLEDVFGMPDHILYRLLPVTIIFAAYSLAVYLLKPKNWKQYLTFIAIANLLYCGLTLVLLFYYFDQVTIVGKAYFFAEIVVIVILSRIELHLADNQRND